MFECFLCLTGVIRNYNTETSGRKIYMCHRPNLPQHALEHSLTLHPSTLTCFLSACSSIKKQYDQQISKTFKYFWLELNLEKKVCTLH